MIGINVVREKRYQIYQILNVLYTQQLFTSHNEMYVEFEWCFKSFQHFFRLFNDFSSFIGGGRPQNNSD